MLFFISGASLALGKFRPRSFVQKVGGITAAGLLQNFLIWKAGPQDPECSFSAAKALTKCSEQGVLLDFTVASHSGSIFPIMFQFWYTIFLMLFVAEDVALYLSLQALSAGASLSAQLPAVALRWLGVSALYAYFCWSSLPRGDLLLIMVLEAVFS